MRHGDRVRFVLLHIHGHVLRFSWDHTRLRHGNAAHSPGTVQTHKYIINIKENMNGFSWSAARKPVNGFVRPVRTVLRCASLFLVSRKPATYSNALICQSNLESSVWDLNLIIWEAIVLLLDHLGTSEFNVSDLSDENGTPYACKTLPARCEEAVWYRLVFWYCTLRLFLCLYSSQIRS